MTSAVVSPRYFHHPPADLPVTDTNVRKTLGLQERTIDTDKNIMTTGRRDSADGFSSASRISDGSSPPASAAAPSYDTAQQPHATQPTQTQHAYYNQWSQYCQQWANYYQYMTQAGGPQYQIPVGASSHQAMPMPHQQTFAGYPSYINAEAQYAINRQLKPRSNARARSFATGPTHSQRFDQIKDMSSAQHRDGTNNANVDVVRKDKHKDPKIMLPAPQPSIEYILQASLQPVVFDPPDLKLVILDLNGTLLHRPNPRKQPTKMIGRPFLPQFLQYLFDNFAVMIWSSARPQNVKILVERGLQDYQSQLVANWARDTLGLAPHHYSKNVQCYKDLRRIWASDEVQCNMIGYEDGKRFDQRNTILIDDSALKASAQPHNLLEIPEFKGVSHDDLKQDILGEVAGYLELLKMQEDVSKFIFRTPFKADGTWSFDWQNLAPKAGPSGNEDITLQPTTLGSE